MFPQLEEDKRPFVLSRIFGSNYGTGDQSVKDGIEERNLKFGFHQVNAP